MLVLTAAVVFQSYDRAEEAAAEQVLQVTRGTLMAVDRELNNQIAALEVLALAPSLHTGRLEDFRADAERFLTRFPAGTAISVADKSGAQLLNTYADALPAPVRPEALESIAAIFGGKGPQVSNVYLSRRTGEPTFTVSVPVSRAGEIVYAIAFNPPRTTFAEILRRLELPDGWVLAIFDRAAHHVARRPNLSLDTVTSASDSLRAELAAGDERLTETTSVEGTRVLTGFTRSPEIGWVVAVGIPVDEYRAPTQRSLITTLAIGAALIFIGGFFAFRVAGQLVRAEGHRELLVNELNHRVKNTLSSVQAIVWRGLRNSGAPPEVRQGIDSRLQTLSSAHNLLSRKNWEGAHLPDVIESILAPYSGQQGARVKLEGPVVALRPPVAIALALVANELATNAVKYGSLAAGNGIVRVAWSLPRPDRLRIDWTESGGPVVQPPTRTGYGTKFIERAVVDELHGAFCASFPPEGMRCSIEVEL